MIIRLFISTLALTALVCGCVTTGFTEYRGGVNAIQGKGGTVRVVDGVDFWDSGDPNRKYTIIGVINDSRTDGSSARKRMDSAIARIAREHGGDAVILIGAEKEIEGANVVGNRIGVEYRLNTKVLVVKYVE